MSTLSTHRYITYSKHDMLPSCDVRCVQVGLVQSRQHAGFVHAYMFVQKQQYVICMSIVCLWARYVCRAHHQLCNGLAPHGIARDYRLTCASIAAAAAEAAAAAGDCARDLKGEEEMDWDERGDKLWGGTMRMGEMGMRRGEPDERKDVVETCACGEPGPDERDKRSDAILPR